MSNRSANDGRVAFLDEPDATLYVGDSLHVLRDLPSASVDAVITDPPYSSGGLHRSDRNRSTTDKYVQTGTFTARPEFQGDHRDQRSYLAWCSLWISECARIVKPGRPCLIFSDWRQLPVTTDALQAGGFVWRGVIIWDKGPAARPSMGFKNQAEYVVWGTLGPIDLGYEMRDLGVLHCPVKKDEKEHQTGKPLALMERLAAIVPEGATILDPFAGSGSTLVAARRCGRRAIGVEISPEYAEITRARLGQMSLLAAEGAA